MLEIGTGTGYNAALLSHRLGDQHVYSVDIDPKLVEDARRQLSQLGYRPTLVAGDGAQGLDPPGMYDRIIATGAVTHVPWAWAEQTADGGLGGRRGQDSRHRRQPRAAAPAARPPRRRFDSGTATFMQMRSPTQPALAESSSRICRDHSTARTLTVDRHEKRLWENPPLWFLIHAHEPGRIEFGYTQDPETGGPGAEFYVGRDGSWCELTTLPIGLGRFTKADHASSGLTSRPRSTSGTNVTDHAGTRSA